MAGCSVPLTADPFSLERILAKAMISLGGNCGRHTAEDRAFLDSYVAELRADLALQEQEHLCTSCGARAWAPALADAPECCDWSMVGLPSFRPLEAGKPNPPVGLSRSNGVARDRRGPRSA